jgi:hypothetical protein
VRLAGKETSGGAEQRGWGGGAGEREDLVVEASRRDGDGDGDISGPSVQVKRAMADGG